MSTNQIIHDLTVAAFEPMSYSNGSEATIIAGLRKDGDLTVSLVAVAGADIVGHVAFSPVAVTPDELGDAWDGGKLHLPLSVDLNGKAFGRANAGGGRSRKRRVVRAWSSIRVAGPAATGHWKRVDRGRAFDPEGERRKRLRLGR